MKMNTELMGNKGTNGEYAGIYQWSKETDREVVTIGLGRGIDPQEVKQIVQQLQKKGYLVYAPFYIVNELGEIGQKAAMAYLKDSIKKSNIFYILNTEQPEPELLMELRAFAIAEGKIVMERGVMNESIERN